MHQETPSVPEEVGVRLRSLMRLSHSTASGRLKDLRKRMPQPSPSDASLTVMKGREQMLNRAG
jgi:hypothetical protein